MANACKAGEREWVFQYMDRYAPRQRLIFGKAGRLPGQPGRGYRAQRVISRSRLAASSIRPRRVLGDTGPNGARVRSEAMMPPSASRIFCARRPHWRFSKWMSGSRSSQALTALARSYAA